MMEDLKIPFAIFVIGVILSIFGMAVEWGQLVGIGAGLIIAAPGAWLIEFVTEVYILR